MLGRKKQFINCLGSVCFGLMGFEGQAHEGHDHDGIESYFLDECPVVLSANRLKQSLSEASAAITVIDREMIRASGAKEIVELFRLVPGMQVGYIRQSQPSVTYHGMSDEFARVMQVLIDGQSVYNASFGGVFWTDYPLQIEDIERIEVVRGPSAASYGPNAFLGTINIITAHASRDQGLEANFRGGDADYYRGVARYGGKWDDLDYRISLKHNQDDGMENKLDSQKVDSFNTRFDYRLGPDDVLQYNFGYTEGKHELGVENNLSDPPRIERGISLSQNLRWEHHIKADELLTMHLTHNRSEQHDDFISNGRPISNDQLAERIDFELQHNFVPFDATRVVWGVGSRLDRTRLKLWIGDDDKTNVLYRVFSNIEWRFLDDFTLNLGALLEHNSYIDVDVSPKASLNYRLNEDHGLRAIVSRASRMSTLGEQNMDLKTPVETILRVRARSPELVKPEEVINYELGYHGELFNKTLVADMKFAYQRFHRLSQIYDVSFDPQTFEPILEYGHKDGASAINYELQLDYKPVPEALLHAGYSWVNIDHAGGFQNYRESAPHHSFNILSAYRFPGNWESSAAYYYRSEMQYLRSNPIDSFQRLDFVLRKTIPLDGHQKLELAFIHRNNLGSSEEFMDSKRLDDRTFFEIAYYFD